jgi:hypothetical protein
MMRTGCLDKSDVRVVEPGGVALFQGDKIDEKKQSIGWLTDAIQYDAIGRLQVSERIRKPAIMGDPLSDYSRFTPVDPTEWK